MMKFFFGRVDLKPLAIGTLLAVLMTGLYSSTASRQLTGYADSDELIVAVHRQQLAHPPGYPLLVRMWWPISRWFFGQELIVWMQQSASLNTGINVLLVYVLAYQVSRGFTKQTKREAIALAFLSAWAWGLMYSTWLHATVFEVFPLAQTLILLGWLCYLSWWQKRESKAKRGKWRGERRKRQNGSEGIERT